MFRLAHITDPHFRGWAGLGLADVFSKRLVGLANLFVHRRRAHRMELLEELRQDLARRAFDHLVVTGDLSNVGLEGEWRAALRWLAGCGATPEAITVIPGNHDTYTPSVVASGLFERLFEPYQTAELRARTTRYPFVRLRGKVALVGVNSCVPTGDLHAWGRIGEEQLRELETLLASEALRGFVRVVLVHHPPVMLKPPETRNLRDRLQLVGALARAGAELVLHGHDHRDTLEHVEGPHGVKIPVIGGGSASYAGRPEARARYNIYEIDEAGVITWVTYAHDLTARAFKETRRQRLGPDGASRLPLGAPAAPRP
jgi:3',5'-cyclic AMP phosphodiesterase CpdA